jgi:hypothetical protein
MLLPSCLHMLTFTGMTISQSTDLSNGPTFFIFLSLGVSICLDSLDYPTMSRNLNRDSRSRHFKNRHLDTSKPKSRQSRLPYNVEKSQSRLSISAFQKPTSQHFKTQVSTVSITLQCREISVFVEISIETLDLDISKTNISTV